MKKNLILFLIAMLAIASCKTRERIVYFQDIVPNENIATQSTTALKLVPGDKVGVIVTSAATPELAARYNLTTGNNSTSNTTCVTPSTRMVISTFRALDVHRLAA